MNCSDYERLIQLYVDRLLDDEEKKQLLHHISHCPDCDQELRDMIVLVSRLESLPSLLRPVKKRIRWFGVPVSSLIGAMAIVFVAVFMFPVMMTPKPGEPIEQSALTQAIVPTPIVLASESEQLPMPDAQSFKLLSVEEYLKEEQPGTTVVYPSALVAALAHDHLFDAKRKYIFVGVPDRKTLDSLLTRIGGHELSTFEEISVPSSLLYLPGDPPKLVSFSFPEKQEQLSDWFTELNSYNDVK